MIRAALALWSASAGAEVARIEITSREPMNDGQAVGAAGPFEIIRGKVHGGPVLARFIDVPDGASTATGRIDRFTR